MTHSNNPLLVVHPSLDYARRVCSHFPNAVFIARPARAKELRTAGFRALAADLSDGRAALRCATDYALTQRLCYAGIACFVCEYLPLTALLAAGLGLPYVDVQTAALLRDKARCGALWERSGVPVPTAQRIDDLSELETFASTCSPPWIIKPIDATGSEWVLRIDDPSQLADAHTRIQHGLRERFPNDPSPAYLAQRCIQGREFGVDFFIEGQRLRILRLCEKFLVETPTQAGVVGGYCIPHLPQRLRRQLQDTLRQAARAVGMMRGIGMADLILSNDVFYLLEMAPRPGGDCLPDLCRAAFNYDPIRATCEAAIGETPRAIHWPHPRRPLCALHLMSDREGTIQQIDFSALRAHGSFYKLIEAYCEPGDTLRHWAGSYEDRIVASCLAYCPDSSGLADLWRELSDAVHITFANELEPNPL